MQSRSFFFFFTRIVVIRSRSNVFNWILNSIRNLSRTRSVDTKEISRNSCYLSLFFSSFLMHYARKHSIRTSIYSIDRKFAISLR